MPSQQIPPVRIDDDLDDAISTFQSVNGLDTESAAIRELLHRGLRERRMSVVAFFLATGWDLDDVVDRLDSNALPALTDSWRELFRASSAADVNVLEVAGGPDELSKENLAAAYRFERGEATLEDLDRVLDLLAESGLGPEDVALSTGR